MRKQLSVMAGAVALLATGAQADFVGLEVIQVHDNVGTAGLAAGTIGGAPTTGAELIDGYVVRAIFNNAADNVNAIYNIGGVTSFSLSSDTNVEGNGAGSGFYNWGLGANIPVASNLSVLAPGAAGSDTAITIGLLAGFAPGTNAGLFAPGSEVLLAGLTGSLNISASDFGYATTPDDAQSYGTDIGDGLFAVNLFQFGVLNGESASGVINIQFSNTPLSGGGNAEGITFTTIPAPGAMALLGLAGIAGVTRRRRTA